MSSSCQTGSISQQCSTHKHFHVSHFSCYNRLWAQIQTQRWRRRTCLKWSKCRITSCLYVSEVNTSEFCAFFFFFSCCFWISSTCVRWWPSPHTQDVCVWATVGLNRNCWPAGGSELVEDIWAQLDRVWVWAGSTIETCRIGGLGPFGKAIVGSRPVSDTEVSGVSQLMIQERWSWANRLAGWGPTCPRSEDTTAGKHIG